MQSFSWTPEHCETLRRHVAAGLSFSEVADALNEKFGTDLPAAPACPGRA